jgi:hypothetical protein
MFENFNLFANQTKLTTRKQQGKFFLNKLFCKPKHHDDTDKQTNPTKDDTEKDMRKKKKIPDKHS